MKLAKPVFLSDVPVSLEDNLLWPEDSTVMHQIQTLAETILSTDGKLTFAVHGAWGAGKTSFLRMVQDSVSREVDRMEVLFCWYEASIYQEMGDPGVTLALRIWNTLGGEDETRGRYTATSYEALVDYMQGILAEEFVDTEDRIRPYQAVQSLARKTGRMPDFPRLIEDMLTEGGLDGLPKKLVLVVDDLDRCRSGFIVTVLDELQRLSRVRNLFTLISVDREILLKAIKDRYEDVLSVRDEHLALEKYIQYDIELPEITTESLVEFIRHWIPIANEGSHEELDVISDCAHYFAVGVRVKTPRAVKRSINAVRPILAMRFSQEQDLSDEEQQLIVKEQLLAYNWRDFHQAYFQTAHRDYNAEQFFRQLERICVTLYSEEREMTPEEQRDRRAIFDLQLERIKRREFSEAVKLVIPDELARLLAASPQWFYGHGLEAEPDVVDRLAAMTFGGPSLDDQFMKLYLQSEQADAVGDASTSIEAAAQAYDLVRKNRTSFGKDVSPRLGNLGVNAEKYKVHELTEAVFRLALEIDEHSGVLQQFASYILDSRPELYDEAGAILEKLQTPQHAHYKPWRTLQLLIQHKSATNQEIGEDLIDRLTKVVEGEANVRQLGAMLDALVRAGRYESSVELLGKSVNRFSDRNSRYALQRILADALAQRSEEETELIAMDLYRQILANPEVMDSGDEPHVMHNYATLLYKHDYDDEAGCLWFTAYNGYPSVRRDNSIRSAYSMYLLRSDRKDLAQKIFEGESVDEMVLVSTDKTLPEQFSEIDLPDALGEIDTPTAFSCLDRVS